MEVLGKGNNQSIAVVIQVIVVKAAINASPAVPK